MRNGCSAGGNIMHTKARAFHYGGKKVNVKLYI